MKKTSLTLLIGLFSLQVHANAPVLDNSEDYRSQSSYSTGASSTETGSMQLLLAKIEQMQQEISSLRGQVEVQSHELAKLTGRPLPNAAQSVQQNAAENTPVTMSHQSRNEPESRGGDDVSHVAAPVHQAKEQRVDEADIKNQQVESKQNIEPKAQEKADVVDEQLSYLAAFELVKNRDYEKALPAMDKFLQAYPKGPYAANAHYWRGELFLLKQNYPEALSEFSIVINEFADSNKLAAAKLKLGMTYERLGQKNKARQQYVSVSEEFPDTSAAVLAKVKLNEL